LVKQAQTDMSHYLCVVFLAYTLHMSCKVYIMDKEVKKFILKYMEDVDEEVYQNFIKLFSKRPAKYIKKENKYIYLKCKQFSKENENQSV